VRAFIAVDLDARVQQSFVDLQAGLRRELPDVAWTRPEKLHITLVFFEELPDAGKDRVIQVMDRTAAEGLRPQLRLRDVGAFPSLSRPRVLWCGVENGDGLLRAIREDLATELRSAGVVFDDKRFTPHCTLGRVRSRWAPEVRRAWQELAAHPFESDPWTPASLRLFRSAGSYELLHDAWF
jgi:2'-5' RNA ligase